MPANIPSETERSQRRCLISPLLFNLARSRKSASSEGATVAIALVVAFAVIAGTAIVAQRSFDGLLGSVFQGRAKDARLTAEAGTAFIISEWNRPANRTLYTGLPMASWSSAKNQCTAASPTYNIASALNPTAEATSFANGNEVILPTVSTDTIRKFKLIRATFTSGSASARGAQFIVTGNPASATGTSPRISQSNPRGFLELVVEGRIYKSGSLNPVATSTVTREFIIEPKCCDRSFGGIIPNDPDSSTNRLGNDSRTCLGGTSPSLGDLGIITGLNGGGLTSQGQAGNNALSLYQGSTNNRIDQVVCVPLTGTTSCSGAYQGSSISTAQGDVDYTTKQISLPTLRSIECETETTAGACDGPALTPMAAITTTKILNPATAPDSSHCVLAGGAYHCKLSRISLSSSRTLTIDTSASPVYIYLQENVETSSNIKTIDLSGSASIRHIKGSANAALEDANDFQIRGIPIPSTSPACNPGQRFDFTGGATSSFFLWAPCSTTRLTGNTGWGGILWTNNLNINGNTTFRVAIPSNTGTCETNTTAPPCEVIGGVPIAKPIDWAARSINFTRFF